MTPPPVQAIRLLPASRTALGDAVRTGLDRNPARPDAPSAVARRAGTGLVLAGKLAPADRPTDQETIAPRLRGRGVEYVGEVDDRGKVELLGNARGLLFPILGPEPFGLAMIEDLACGTPVITRRCGSTPEVIAHGEVGYVCDDDDQLVDAVKRADTLDRSACRRWVERQFSVQRMADRYELVYRELVERRTGNPRPRPVLRRSRGGI